MVLVVVVVGLDLLVDAANTVDQCHLSVCVQIFMLRPQPRYTCSLDRSTCLLFDADTIACTSASWNAFIPHGVRFFSGSTDAAILSMNAM